MSPARIRDASVADAEALARLATQLGYPATGDDMRRRLARVLPGPHRFRVAQLDGAVRGFAIGEVQPLVTSDEPAARLGLLVVEEGWRGRGIGRALVRDFEDWAAGRGARRASLTSGSHRAEAHAFYESLGWERSGVRFARDLSQGPSPDRRLEARTT